jgi:RNA polymerase sigma-70 factor (ECF subfamily)
VVARLRHSCHGLTTEKVTRHTKNIPARLNANLVYAKKASLSDRDGQRSRQEDFSPMNSGPRRRVPPLILVKRTPIPGEATDRDHDATCGPQPREVDWSILMAHAQAGDSDAYRRLLEEITPYLRRLAARRHRDPDDIEDALQDILLTVHAIRHTYEPARPFGPWLVAIANRRLIDRLRRQGRLRSRESTLTAEHETFPADPTNMDDEISDRRALHDAVDKLPARQRQAIRMLKLREMSLKEAAVATGMSVAALKVATHRALSSLRKLLSDRSREP